VSEPRKRPTSILERVAFKTSRLAEFCGEKELTAQTGAPVEDWPLCILKEVLDNALDAAEQTEIAPEISIEVSTATGQIVITDNGPGLPPATVEGVLDYTARISSNEAYISPSRGQQGNALKCIIAMPFAVDGNRGTTVLEAHGLAHKILFEMDPIRREPRVHREISPSLVQIGTRITVHWPDSACSVVVDAEARFVQMAADFTTFNPHLTLSCDWDGNQRVGVKATAPGWRKWRTCDPTSACWYDTDRFGRYIAAHIAEDEDQGRAGRTVRDFVSELRGLARSDKQKIVLAETEASGVSLASFFARGPDAIARLLTSCREHTKPVDPQDLGVIGADHFLSHCSAVGAAEESFKYKKQLGVTSEGLPFVIEVAFAYCPEADRRSITTGVNFSVSIRDPFQRLGHFESLSSLLTRRMAGDDEPIVFAMHYTFPRVDYTDRGKLTLNLPWKVDAAIRQLVEQVTKDWYTQRKREEREASRKYERRDRLISAKQVTIKDAAWQVMQDAYMKASGGGKLPVKPRQIMYAGRPRILAITGKDTLSDEYFTQTLFPNYINEHPERCVKWDITWDARGTFSEPHTGTAVPLGTLEVRQYLRGRPVPGGIAYPGFDDRFPTCGPENRFDSVLFVEKEGFEPLLKSARISERFDIAPMSTKGMSVTASRLLIDELAQRGVRRILVLRDFDLSGFSIFGTLGKTNRRYTFENNVPLIDIALRLADVQIMSLESEPVGVGGDWAKRAATLRRHGASEEEITFLRNRRVELNAMTSPQFIAFLESKFAEHGVSKFIPNEVVIEQHSRRIIEKQILAQSIAKISGEIAEQAKITELPTNLREQIERVFAERPDVPWDEALAQVIRSASA
jgi:DNA topoisomerase VI subunit B